MLHWPAVSQTAQPTLGSLASKGRFLQKFPQPIPFQFQRLTPTLKLPQHFTGLHLAELPLVWYVIVWTTLSRLELREGGVRVTLISASSAPPGDRHAVNALESKEPPEERWRWGQVVFRPHPDPLLAQVPNPGVGCQVRTSASFS